MFLAYEESYFSGISFLELIGAFIGSLGAFRFIIVWRRFNPGNNSEKLGDEDVWVCSEDYMPLRIAFHR
jgi:hypothetical protein